MAGRATIEGVRRGDVSLADLLKLNALLDAQQAAEEQAMKDAKSK